MNLYAIYILLCLTWLFTSGCGGDSVTTSKSFSVFSKSERYEYARSGKNEIWLAVSQGDEPEVILNGSPVTNDDSIQFSPAINEFGDYAYLELRDSFSNVHIVLNGKKISSERTLITKTVFRTDTLFWVEHSKDLDSSFLCSLEVNASSQKCISMAGIIGDLQVADSGVAVIEYLPSDGLFYAHVFSASLERVFSYQSPNSLYVGKNGHFYETNGTGVSNQVFLAVTELMREQRGETFAHSNDFLGRIGWNQNYRIRTLTYLAAISTDVRVRELLREQVVSVLAQHDQNGLLASKKYSLDKTTQIHLAVENANFYSAAIDAAQYLPVDVVEKLLAHAEKFVSYFEQDWSVDSYRFPSCIAVEFDGIVMPFNMQHAVGLVLVGLDEYSGERRFHEKIKRMYEKFDSEVYQKNGVSVWPYWPSEFNNGWGVGEYRSCNNVSREPNTNTLEEDTWHATITADFVEKASSYLGISSRIDLDELAEKISVEFGKFAFLIDGNTQAATPKWSYIPTLKWANSAPIRLHFKKRVILPYVHFDNQWISASHLIASADKSLVGSVTIKEYQFTGKGLLTVSKRTVKHSRESCVVTIAEREPIVPCATSSLDSWIKYFDVYGH